MAGDCKTCGIRKKMTDMAWKLNKQFQPTEEGRYLVKFKNGYRATARWLYTGVPSKRTGSWYTDDDDQVLLTVLKWMHIPK